MPQSFSQIYLHIIFSTKGRAPFLRDATMRENLHPYLAGTCHQLECPSLRVGGVEALSAIALHEPAELVREMKRESSKWVKLQSPSLHEFYWQNGYGAFSISPSHVEALLRYIETQEEHHRAESYQDEFRRICKAYGVELDELHAWE